MGAGIRELGAGNAASASDEALPAAYWNPAALAYTTKTALGFGADVRSLQRHGGSVAIQGKVAGHLGMGIAWAERGDWQVTAYDEDETPLGTARPQANEVYIGLGWKTSRYNSFGASLQWYHSTLDIEGGSGDINQIGIFNVGWLKLWQKGRWKTAIVIRNLGLNDKLSSNFDLTTVVADNATGLDKTGFDFHPKTLILAASHRRKIGLWDFEFSGELLDYQLKDELYVTDANFHQQGFRLGAQWFLNPWAEFRTGYDRGNYSLGFGTKYPLSRSKMISLDYAVLVEREAFLFNPYALGIRYYF